MKAILFDNAKHIQPLQNKMARAYLNSENTWNVPILQCKESPGQQRKPECRKLLLSLVSLKGSVSEKMGRKIEDTRRSGVYGYTSCQPANIRPWPYCSWSFNNEEDWNQVQVGKNDPETLKTLKRFKKEKLRTKPGNSPHGPESINTLRRPQINTVERKLLQLKGRESTSTKWLARKPEKTEQSWVTCCPLIYQCSLDHFQTSTLLKEKHLFPHKITDRARQTDLRKKI